MLTSKKKKKRKKEGKEKKKKEERRKKRDCRRDTTKNSAGALIATKLEIKEVEEPEVDFIRDDQQCLNEIGYHGDKS